MLRESQSVQPAGDRRRRGMALIAVLWVSSLLALLAAGVGSSSRTDLRLAANLAERAKARAMADAGVHQALFRLLTDSEDQVWSQGVIRLEQAIGDGAVRVAIRDEDAKLDLNVVSTELLRGLFLAVGLPDGEAAALADRIGDFRDEDSELSPLGAEDADYRAAGRPAGAADRPFLEVAELANVLGLTDPIYRRIKPYVTVYADIEGLDPTRAAGATLLALPGMTSRLAAYMTQQAALLDPDGGGSPTALPAAAAEKIGTYLVPSRELMFSIDSLGTSAGGGRFLREAVVALDGGARELPFTLYAWRQGRIEDMESPGDGTP